MTFGDLVSRVLQPLADIEEDIGPKRKRGPSAAERKREMVQRFIEDWRRDIGPDIYPAARLIVPELDLERNNFHIKEAEMAKILPQVVGIAKISAHARLLSSSTSNSQPFLDACDEVLRCRPFPTVSKDLLRVDQVSNKLDALSRLTKLNDRVEAVRELAQLTTPDEMMWIIRIILDQVWLDVADAFEDAWHVQARLLRRTTSCLRLVCWELSDPKTRLSDRDVPVKLFRCFQPQRPAHQIKPLRSDQGIMDGTLRALHLRDGETFYVEDQLNGRRTQLHVSVSSGGTALEFRWWSGAGSDWTYTYGATPSGGKLAPYIKDAFQTGLTAAVFDGEMMVYDKDKGSIDPHDWLGPQYSDGVDTWPVFRIYDIVLLQHVDPALSIDITTADLSSRRKMLELLVKPCADRLEIHPAEEATSAAQLQEKFDRAIAEGKDGLVVKDPKSKYCPGGRPQTWAVMCPGYN